MPDTVQLISFAFKRGLPETANMVLDARFLKNPHYEPHLQAMTGLDAEAAAYIESDPAFASFFDQLTTLLLPLLPRYLEDGKDFTLAVGCTGGQHRSVHMVQKLGGFLSDKGYKVSIRHRELE